ncbi:MAG: GAF domain-containing protein [Candidatus Omnitrophota bacterium]|jgi:sigma-B regulation protein RsbU (phosphoserine phosphatase)|nr:MAG: GAF domain-containing protein [Candidatus Omnitrophota bacterium]
MLDLIRSVNLSVGIGIVTYLFVSLSYRGIAEKNNISPFIPILNLKQSRLLIIGFVLWTIALILEILSPSPAGISALLINIARPAILTAATMYIAHSLIIFISLSTRKEKIADSLDRINLYRIAGIAVLVGTVLFSIWLGKQFAVYERLFLSFYMVWQLIIVTHVFSFLQVCKHPMQKALMVLLIVWGINIPAAIFHVAIVTTAALAGFLALILRSNYLYLQETLKRASSFKTEKDVMISFLSKLSSGDESMMRKDDHHEDSVPDDEISYWGGFDLDRLLQIMLDYGMELCGASAGAIFIRDDIHEMFSKTQKMPKRGIFFSARAVAGMYPPTFELGHLPHSSAQIDRIHDMVRSEKVSIGTGVVGQAAKTGKSILISDVAGDPQIQQQHEDYLKIRCILAVPLKLLDQTVAVLSVINKKNMRKGFDHQDEATLMAMAVQAANTLGSAIMHSNLQEKERLQREIELAREVQRLLLPKSCPQITGYLIAARSDPAQDVGGDYYDFLWLDDDRLAIVVADVSGKGIPGALTMATVRSALRAIVTQNKNARDILIELNKFILPDMRQGTFVSMLLAIMKVSTGEIEVVRAGHEPLLLFHRNRSTHEEIAPAGIALGMVDGEFFKANTQLERIQMQEGDKLVLYTDGVTEAMNPSLREFSFERFIKTLEECKTNSAEDTVLTISNRIASFAGKQPQHDDITLVVLQRIKPSRE